MIAAKIVREESEVQERLEALSISRDEILNVAKAALTARNESVANDPVNAPGSLSYIYGTRALRTIMTAKGWRRIRPNNIEAVQSPEGGLKYIFQNADSACNLNRGPQPSSRKGSASSDFVTAHQSDLFEDFAELAPINTDKGLWYLFFYTDGLTVSVELSCPKSIESGQFKGFNERIFVIESADFGGLESLSFDDFENVEHQDFEVNVTRK